MKNSLCLVSIFCIITGLLAAQEHREESHRRQGVNPHEISTQGDRPEIRRRVLVLDIDARVLDNNEDVVWSESHQKVTIPGTPVGIQLVGSNLVVAVQFTPFIRRTGNVIVAQVQIGIKDSDQGIRYYTSIQTIPIEYDETVYFFPLGQSNETSSIEITLKVNPFRETADPEAAINTNNDN